MLMLVLTVLFALSASFMASVAEATILTITHAQIQTLGKSKAADILRAFKREIDVPIAAIVAFHTVAHTGSASVSGAIYVQTYGEHTLWIFSAIFTLLALIFSEILPKTLAVTFANEFAVPVAYGVRALTIVLKPVLWCTNVFARLIRRGREAPVTSVEEIRMLAAFGRSEGALGARVADMIEGAAKLRELTAYDVMVPRARIFYLSGERTLQENMEVIRTSGHSRFPYTARGNLDKTDGVVLVKDLLFVLGHGETADFKEILSPLLVVPASAPLERVLHTFQDERRHIAIVVDEYGGTQGLITLEDVLEEIVGEIEDESDRVDPTIVRRSKDLVVCRGLAETRKIFELVGVEGETEMVTMAGFVADLVGRVPRTGDTVDWNGFRFTVLRSSARRAERIEVKKLATTDEN